MTDQAGKTEFTPGSALQRAILLHQKGNLKQAEKIYRKFLSVQPNHPDALHLLGVLMQQNGRHEKAIELIAKAISQSPDQPLFHNNLGIILGEKGRDEEALSAFTKALHLNPDYAEAHFNRGVVFLKQEQLDRAGQAFTQALRLRPEYPDALNSLGKIYQKKGLIEKALACFDETIVHKPDYAEAYLNRGSILTAENRIDEALADYDRAVEIKPNYAEAHYNRGVVLQKKGRYREALAAYEKALANNPDYTEALNNYGIILFETGRIPEAVSAFTRALKIEPGYVEALNNRGSAYREAGDLKKALKDLNRAINISPDYGEAHWNRAIVLLLQGDFKNGWRDFEWRWQKKDFATPKRHFVQPLWDGNPLHNQTLLIHTEQGAGDSIQFIRYIPVIAKSGGKIIVECEKSLLKLFSTIPEISLLIEKGKRIPHFDVQAPLLSLPYIMKTGIDSIPHQIPYLFPDASAIDLYPDPECKNIGIVWAGNPKHKNDKNRSVDFHYFADLFRIKRTKFYSLQAGPRGADCKTFATTGLIRDLREFLTDYAATASVIRQLDLIISVDTSVAHLAGALGMQIWTLLPFAPDWRWMTERDDSPWYPTMRLFRQPAPGDWNSVFDKVKNELERFKK